MSRDVINMFLTSVDKVDDFIYEDYMVSEEFRAKTEKFREVLEGARIAPMAAPTMWGLAGGPQGHQARCMEPPGVIPILV